MDLYSSSGFDRMRAVGVRLSARFGTRMPTSVCLEAKRLQRRASTFWITLKKYFGRKIAETCESSERDLKFC